MNGQNTRQELLRCVDRAITDNRAGRLAKALEANDDKLSHDASEELQHLDLLLVAAQQEINELADEVKQMKELPVSEHRLNEWRLIETAPMDGSEILICGGTAYYDADTFPTPFAFKGVSIARWVNRYEKEWEGEYGCEYDAKFWHKPTHWMPLPIPPTREDRE